MHHHGPNTDDTAERRTLRRQWFKLCKDVLPAKTQLDWQYIAKVCAHAALGTDPVAYYSPHSFERSASTRMFKRAIQFAERVEASTVPGVTFNSIETWVESIINRENSLPAHDFLIVQLAADIAKLVDYSRSAAGRVSTSDALYGGKVWNGGEVQRVALDWIAGGPWAVAYGTRALKHLPRIALADAVALVKEYQRRPDIFFDHRTASNAWRTGKVTLVPASPDAPAHTDLMVTPERLSVDVPIEFVPTDAAMELEHSRAERDELLVQLKNRSEELDLLRCERDTAVQAADVLKTSLAHNHTVLDARRTFVSDTAATIRTALTDLSQQLMSRLMVGGLADSTEKKFLRVALVTTLHAHGELDKLTASDAGKSGK